ncbi:hypothetical protein C0J52_22771 [Blattella germanica]|nr:hypothetical protein C0J52_22771 [Blattella germanica]
MRVHHLNNVNKALQILEQNNVKLVNISNNDIVDGNPKLTLGLVWSIILHWQVHYHLKDLMSDLQQTNLEKTLLAWCRQNTKDYPGVDVKNFTTSWSDGLAFNALIHRWRSQLFDFHNIARKHPNARLEHAFRIAQEHLGIERLLDPEDVNTSVPDKKSIMMYVMCLFQSLPHSEMDVSHLDISIHSDSSSIASPGAEGGVFSVPSSRPISLATNISVELGGYQVALEEVLTWLLEAEDKLNNSTAIEGGLESIKEQFHSHEGFLLELAGHQEGVGAVLEEGARMLSEGGLSKDEEDEQQIEQHKQLQQDLEEQQRVVDALSNMVVVVDENSPESAYSQMEDQLTALGERWAHICQWTEERCTKLQNLAAKWSQLIEEIQRIQLWLDNKETQLKQMEANPLVEIGEVLDRIKKLQVLRLEMDAQQRHILVLQESVQQFQAGPDSANNNDMLEKIETLQDRWDALIQIMEVQGQRITASGFEFNMTPAPGEIVTTVTSGSQWEVKETITTVTSQEKRRVGSATRLEFEAALTQLNSWMEHTETTLSLRSSDRPTAEPSGAFDGLSVEEQLVMYEDMESDVQNHKGEVEKVVALGRRLVEEMQNENETIKDEEQKVSEIEHRWSGLPALLQERKERIQFLQEKKQLYGEISSLELILEGYQKWLEGLKSTPQGQVNVSHQLEQCRVKIKSMKSHEDRITKMRKRAADLSANIEMLRQFRDEMEGLNSWLQEVEAFLEAEEDLPVGDIETLDAQLEQSNALQDDIETLQPNVNNIESTSQKLLNNADPTFSEELRSQVGILMEKWKIVVKGAKEQNVRLKDALEKSKKSDVEAITLRWSHLSQQIGYYFPPLNIRDVYKRQVQEAQESESHILEFQEWVTHVDALLTARVENDLTADDLPDDDQRLVEEFETQESTLKEMEDQVKTYTSAGKHEAAARLQEQMILLQKRFTEVQVKFQRFRSPTNLEPRLSRALRELRGVEEATCLLELASDDPEGIEGQLKHCMRTVEEDVPKWSIIKDGIKSSYKTFSGICDPVYLEVLKERVNDTVKKWERLEGRLRNLLPILEKENAISARNKLEEFTKSVEEMNKWLNEVESKVNKLDVLPAHQLAEVHVSECKGLQNIMCRRKPDVDALREAAVELMSQENQQELKGSVEPYLIQINCRWGELLHRIRECCLLTGEVVACGFLYSVGNISNLMWRAWVYMRVFTVQGWSQNVTNMPKSSSTAANDSSLTTDVQTTPSGGDSKGREPQEISFLVLEDKTQVSVTEPQEHVTPIFPLVSESSKSFPSEEAFSPSYSIQQTGDDECMGYLNPVFEDMDQEDHLATQSEERKSKPLVGNIIDSERPDEASDLPAVSSVPDVVQMVERAKSTESEGAKQPVTEAEMMDEDKREDDRKMEPSLEIDDSDTFRLAKDSMLFSQVSTNTLVTSSTEMENMNVQQEADPCQVVEVKAIEIEKSVATPVGHIEQVVLPSRSVETTEQFGPQSVEMVEIIEEVETEPEESAPETDTESSDKKKLSPDVPDVAKDTRKRPSTLDLHDVQAKKSSSDISDLESKTEDDSSDERKEDFDTVISNKKMARLSPKKDDIPQQPKKLSDEEIIRVSEDVNWNAGNKPVTELLTETADRMMKSPPKVSIPGYSVEVHATPTPPPTPAIYPSDVPPPLCLQMTDRVNKTEETTVTAWRDSENAEYLILDDANKEEPYVANGVAVVSKSPQFALSEDGQKAEHNKSPDLKEVILKKEIEVSKTYKIIGNFSDPNPCRNTAMVVATPGMDDDGVDDYNSFYGSDKETDDVIEFSDDGEPPHELNDSSSSEDESPSLGQLVMQHFDKAILSSRKEAYVSKHREKPHSITSQRVIATSGSEVPHTPLPHTTITTVTTTKVTVTQKQQAPQPTPRTVSSKREITSSSNLPPSLAKDIAEFEHAAQQMLRRMDVMLVTVKGVSNEKDPGKRLEARKTEAQQGEDKLKEYNRLLAELQIWLKDAKRRLEQANNEEGQLKAFQEEFEKKENEIQSLNQKCVELEKLQVGRGDTEETVASINDRITAMESAANMKDETTQFMDSTQVCLDQVKALLGSTANPSDDTSLAVRLSMVKAREEELAGKRREMEALKKSKQLPSSESLKNLNSSMDKASTGLSDHREYIECKLSSLKKYTTHLDVIIAWVMETKTRINISKELPDKEKKRVIDNIMNSVYDRETEVKEVLENFTNLEKECEGAKQPVSIELQEKIKKLREDWQYVKNRGEDPTPQEPVSSSTQGAAASVTKETLKPVTSTPKPPSGRTAVFFNFCLLYLILMVIMM